MDRETKAEIERGEDRENLSPTEMLMQHRGQRPEQGRCKPGDQGEVRDAALRIAVAQLHDRDERCAVEHEARGELHRQHTDGEAKASWRQRAKEQCARCRQRAGHHQAARAEFVRPAAGKRREDRAREQRCREDGKYPLRRPGELRRDGRREDAVAVEERPIADNLGDTERPDRGRRSLARRSFGSFHVFGLGEAVLPQPHPALPSSLAFASATQQASTEAGAGPPQQPAAATSRTGPVMWSALQTPVFGKHQLDLTRCHVVARDRRRRPSAPVRSRLPSGRSARDRRILSRRW